MQGQVHDEKTPTIRWTERPTGSLVGVVSPQPNNVIQFWYSCSLPLSPVTILQSCKKIPTGCCNLNWKYHSCLYPTTSTVTSIQLLKLDESILLQVLEANFLLSFSLCRRDQLQETNGCTHYSCESVAPDPSKRWPQYKLWRRLLSRAANYWRDSTSRGLLQKITYCGLKNGFLRIWSTFEFSASPVTQRLQNGLLKRIRRMSTRLATILSRLLWCKYL
jgi:hypothetical protein